jgi:hypothetical protein
MKKRTLPFTFVVLSMSGALPLLAGCPKDPPPVVFDAAPPPVVSSAEPVDLAPLEDAGLEEFDADADAGPKKPGVNINVARVRACCNAIAAQGKALGASPEAAIINGIAGSCTVAANQLSPSSTGAELAPIRNALKASGKAIPGVCN